MRERTTIAGSCLGVANHQDVAVLHNVFLAFEPKQGSATEPGIAVVVDKRLPVDSFGADKLLLEVRMNGSGGLLGGAVLGNGPRPDFRFARREEAHEAEQVVSPL